MSYFLNKDNRRKTKYNNILQRDFDVTTVDSPSEILVICNGGLCNGITYDMVYNTFEKFGSLENVIMVPGKSYCFIKFQDKHSALTSFNSIHGEVIWKEIKGPVYLSYIKSIPPSLLQNNPVFQKPPGLIVLENFISLEEELNILDIVGFKEADENSSELKHRKVKHFGYEFKYSNNNVDLNDPIHKIPDELNFLWDRLKKYLGDIDFVPDQLTINCYEPGQGIPPHVDTHSAFENIIVSLSLQSSIVMEFKNHTGSVNNVLLPRRSICLMTGESRYDWTHAITPRKTDIIVNSNGCITLQKRETRTSLTFRKTRKGDCTCKYPRLCDSNEKNIQDSIDKVGGIDTIRFDPKIASDLEGSYVHEVYEKIASHFSETRHKPWPNVLKFVQSFEVGSVIIDVGCGNGKYFLNQSSCFEVGCDSSSSLMEVCRERGFECFSCNCLSIPLQDNIADGCICIAVIHHLTTEERRFRAIKEIIRVLRSKGKALIYVWAKNQEKNNEKSSYLKQCNEKKKNKDNGDFHIVPLNDLQTKLVLPVHTNRTNFDYSDLLVPWKLKKKHSDLKDSVPESVYLRFYHVYEDNELKEMCQKLDNVIIIDYYYDQGNWCILLQKK